MHFGPPHHLVQQVKRLAEHPRTLPFAVAAQAGLYIGEGIYTLAREVEQLNQTLSRRF